MQISHRASTIANKWIMTKQVLLRNFGTEHGICTVVPLWKLIAKAKSKSVHAHKPRDISRDMLRILTRGKRNLPSILLEWRLYLLFGFLPPQRICLPGRHQLAAGTLQTFCWHCLWCAWPSLADHPLPETYPQWALQPWGRWISSPHCSAGC